MVSEYAVDPVHEDIPHKGIRMLDGEAVKLYRECDMASWLNDPDR